MLALAASHRAFRRLNLAAISMCVTDIPKLAVVAMISGQN
jgi:hypothetical protein